MSLCVILIIITSANVAVRGDVVDKNEAVAAALDIVKAQAGARSMSEDEILSMVKSIADGILAMAGDCQCQDSEVAGAPVLDPKKAVKEASIVCLECGKSFKVITKKHLASHNLSAEEYRTKHCYKKAQPLVCKSLVRERRAKMKEMKLWERRTKSSSTADESK